MGEMKKLLGDRPPPERDRLPPEGIRPPEEIKPSRSDLVNWSSEAITEAVFKRYENFADMLFVYVEGQENPIVCTSNHTGDYQQAVKYVKDLCSGERVMYCTRGVNVYSPKDWFYKIERI